MKYPSPISVKTFEDMANRWITIINRHESASIINLSKRNQIYRIDQFINDHIFLKKNLKSFNQTQFITLFASTLLIEDERAFRSYIEEKLDKSKKRYVFLVIDADCLLRENRELLSYLNSLRTGNLSVSLLYFFQKNITLPQYNPQQLSMFSSLFENIHIIPLFDNLDTDQFVIFAKKYFNISLPEQVAKNIKEHCGGRFWLVLEAIRHYAETKNAKNIFDHDEMRLKLQIIWNDYDTVEKTILEKITRNTFSFTQFEKPTLNYLVKIRLIKKMGTCYSITIPVLASYIKSQLNDKTKIEIDNNGQITINNVVTNGFFSKQEKRLIIYFLKNQEKIIKRDDAASVLWGKNLDGFTDWALDQAIYRIRHKFKQLGLDSVMIATKKNQGFIFTR